LFDSVLFHVYHFLKCFVSQASWLAIKGNLDAVLDIFVPSFVGLCPDTQLLFDYEGQSLFTCVQILPAAIFLLPANRPPDISYHACLQIIPTLIRTPSSAKRRGQSFKLSARLRRAKAIWHRSHPSSKSTGGINPLQPHGPRFGHGY
jgi:hypothetical protein